MYNKVGKRLFYSSDFFMRVVHALMCAIFPLTIAIFIYPMLIVNWLGV
jgi:hypothetical protein